MNILIVEDEERLAETLGEIMRKQKYTCDVVYDGKDGLYYAESGIYDVILLDVMLPGMNGFDVVRKIREKNITTPVLMLTARDEVNDKIKGLDNGADDYLTKPFSPDELLARVRAMSRRKGEVVLDELRYQDLTLDLTGYTLSRGDKSIHLGFKEFEIMRLFMSNPKNVFSKDDLLTKIWGYESEAEDNNVEVYISFLRKKLAYLDSDVNIQTLRRIGYTLGKT